MDLINSNEKYGIFEVIEMLDERAKDGHQLCRIRCTVCGREFKRPYSHVISPTKIVEKCTHKRANGEDIPYGSIWNNKRIGGILSDMLTRCYNPNDKNYKWYGAKGIGVYEEWRKNPASFECWAEENGYSDNLTIDRIDPEKDYCPDNCHWITMEDNARWKTGTHHLFEGNSVQVKTGRQLANELGLGTNVINKYIRKYGEEETMKFIEAYRKNPISSYELPNKTSYFEYYMG